MLLCKYRAPVSSGAHTEFFNSLALAGMIPVRLCLRASCSPAPFVQTRNWFISLISKQGPVTQREEKHIQPVTFESQWAPAFFDTLHQLATNNERCSVRSDSLASVPLNLFCNAKFLMSCWHWWSQTSAGPSQFMMGYNQLDSTTSELEFVGSQACVKLISSSFACQPTSQWIISLSLFVCSLVCTVFCIIKVVLLNNRTVDRLKL